MERPHEDALRASRLRTIAELGNLCQLLARRPRAAMTEDEYRRWRMAEIASELRAMGICTDEE